VFDSVQFNKSSGKRKENTLKLMGLTTCSFCRKAKEFLDEHDFDYEYLYLDKIDPDEKKRLKEEFAKNFDKRMSYPTLIINDKKILTGFIRIAWEQELLKGN